MKKNILISIFFVFTIIFCLSSIKSTIAQDEFSVFINSSKEDGNKMIKAYAGPMLEAIGNNFNTGWYNTADPLKKWKFDIRFVGSFSFASDKYKTFNIEELDLTYLTSNKKTLPTILGDEDDATTFSVNVDDPNNLGEFEYLYSMKVPTLGINGFPGFTPQVNFGLPGGTEIMIRALPNLSISTGGTEPIKTKIFGIGLKHDIKQWIPVIKHLPFSLSIMGTYSSTNLSMNGPFLDEDDLLPNFSYTDQQEIMNNPGTILADYEKQEIEFDTKSWNISLLASKKFPIITFFGGLGISHSSTTLSLNGEYPYVKNDSDDNKVIINTDDPINVEVEKTQFGASGGFRIKLGFISLSTSGTYAPNGYSSVSAALGFGFFN